MCPKCGAVTVDGKCTSCGYKIPGVSSEVKQPEYQQPVYQEPEYQQSEYQNSEYETGSKEPNTEAENIYTQSIEKSSTEGYVNAFNCSNPYNNEEKGKKDLVPVLLGVIAFVLLILFILVIFLVIQYTKLPEVSTGSNVPNNQNETSASDDFDLFNYFGEKGENENDGGENSEWALTGETTEYFKEHMDDLLVVSPTIIEKSGYDFEDKTAYDFDDYVVDVKGYELTYGYLIYNNNNLSVAWRLPCVSKHKKADKINEEIYKECLGCIAMYDMNKDAYGDGVTYNAVCTPYVTYMDEDRLSIAMQLSLVASAGQSSVNLAVGIGAVTFDMNSGEVVDMSKELPYPQNFGKEFSEKCETQNNTKLDKDIKEFINKAADQNELIIFYTPLGVEVGVNYESYTGWITATYTDLSYFK